MSIQLNVNFSSMDRLAQQLNAIGDYDKPALLDAIGVEVETQTRRRLRDEKTDPDGFDWKELDPNYAARKKKYSSGGLLEFEGNLIDSIQHVGVNGHAVAVGSNLVYAAVQHEQREYLGLSEENEADLEWIVDDFIQDHLNAL